MISINNLEELRQIATNKELGYLFEKCLSKKKEEIIEIFKERGFEISDDCAAKCYEFCSGIEPIDESDLVYAAGGRSENGSLPPVARNYFENAIKALIKYKAYIRTEVTAFIAQGIIDDFRELLSKPFVKGPFLTELMNLQFRVFLLPDNPSGGNNQAMTWISEGRVIVHREAS